MTDAPLPAWRLFWAKTDRDGTLNKGDEWTRPLWAHLLDVAHTALLLWERTVPDALRQDASAALGLDEREAGHLLSLWLGLHDWGKAIPSFQSQHPASRDALEAAGLRFGAAGRLHHGHATIALVHRAADGGAAFWTHLGAFVGIHHGWLCSRSEWEDHALLSGPLGHPGTWAGPQADLHREVSAVWRRRYPWPDPPRVPPDRAPNWLLGLAGWATYADWLGSIAPCFTADVMAGDDLDTYLDASREGAERALARVGLKEPRQGLVARPFGELFEGYDPRPLQALVLDEVFPVTAADGPTLTILEAPTGEGKTEAALALAARQQDGRRGGLFLGLPTQATANGLMDRAVRFLQAAHDGEAADFRLAHGRAQLLDVQRDLVQPDLLEAPGDLGSIADDDGAPRGTDARVRTLQWFLSSKRALLAPYGLGTIDQAMLGAVRGRHFFLRLYGLAGKTVVLDEVHAYDVYMQAIIGRLLGWLRALGAHVIVLSATLPARLRAGLIEAWDPTAEPALALPAPAEVAYPAVWTVADGAVRLHDHQAGARLVAERTQRATLNRHDPSPEAVAETVAAAVDEGAVVGIIVNTVARAQAVFQAVTGALGGQLAAADVVLFHARFLHRDRETIERAVVGHIGQDGAWVPGRFGKGRAAGPAVLIATQVAEQSLDLDLDLLLSDLAPVDLLLQRAGRLHRHDRDDRPERYDTPHVHWLCPEAPADGLPEVRSDEVPFGFVYDPVVLWRTWRLLRSREEADGTGQWTLPDDYRPLIEAVYPADETLTSRPAPPADLSDDAATRWVESVEGGRKQMLDSMRAAATQTIPKAGELAALVRKSYSVLHDEDDGSAHRTLRAATREGDSIEAVVLFEGPAGALFLDLERTHRAPLDLPGPKQSLPTEAVRALLGASVRLSQPAVMAALRERGEADGPAAWRAAMEATPALRNAQLMTLKKSPLRIGGRLVSYDPARGLLLERPST